MKPKKTTAKGKSHMGGQGKPAKHTPSHFMNKSTSKTAFGSKSMKKGKC